MKTARYFICIACVFVLFFQTGCKSKSPEKGILSESDSSKVVEDAVKKAKSIFYHMYLPSEMYKIFEKGSPLAKSLISGNSARGAGGAGAAGPGPRGPQRDRRTMTSGRRAQRALIKHPI